MLSGKYLNLLKVATRILVFARRHRGRYSVMAELQIGKTGSHRVLG